MLRLHDSASSGNAYKVRLLLTQLGIRFQRIEYEIDQGATRTPEFLRRTNANGRIPVLELEDGRCLAESNAILWYLAEGTPFVPQDRWQRAQALQWMFFEQYSHEPNIATVRYWITHQVSMTHERDAALAGKRRQGLAALRVMEQHLERHAFFVGDRYSIADIALCLYARRARRGLRPRPVPRRRRLAFPRRRTAGIPQDHRLSRRQLSGHREDDAQERRRNRGGVGLRSAMSSSPKRRVWLQVRPS